MLLKLFRILEIEYLPRIKLKGSLSIMSDFDDRFIRFSFVTFVSKKIGLSAYIILSCFYCMSVEIEFTRCHLNKGYILNIVGTIYF